MSGISFTQLRQLITAAVPSMEGWCTVEKALALANNVVEHDAQVIVEIGVFGGRSFLPLALALQALGHGIAYGIDPWKKEAALEGTNDPVNNEWWGKIDYTAIQEGCIRKIWELGLDKQTVLLRCQAHICASLFTEPIDVLHIDGNHSEEASTRDVAIWLPKVKKGGFIWFDDCDWKTTAKAQADLLKFAKKVGGVGECHLFQKQ